MRLSLPKPKSGSFYLPKPPVGHFSPAKADDGGFTPVSKSTNRILPAKTDKNPILLTAIGKSPIQPAKIGKHQLLASQNRFRIGESSIFACRNGEKVQKAAGGQKAAAPAAVSDFRPYLRKNRLSLVFSGRFRTVLPKISVRRKKPICLFAADLSGPPGKDIHDKIFVVIFHHGDCGVFVSGIYDISVMSRRRNPTFDHSGGGVFRYAVYNGS